MVNLTEIVLHTKLGFPCKIQCANHKNAGKDKVKIECGVFSFFWSCVEHFGLILRQESFSLLAPLHNDHVFFRNPDERNCGPMEPGFTIPRLYVLVPLCFGLFTCSYFSKSRPSLGYSVSFPFRFEEFRRVVFISCFFRNSVSHINAISTANNLFFDFNLGEAAKLTIFLQHKLHERKLHFNLLCGKYFHRIRHDRSLTTASRILPTILCAHHDCERLGFHSCGINSQRGGWMCTDDGQLTSHGVTLKHCQPSEMSIISVLWENNISDPT